MKNYYYLDASDEVLGPFPLSELDSLHKSARLTAVTKVCEEGTEKWMPFFEIPRPAPLPKVIKKEEEVAKEPRKSEPKKFVSAGGVIADILLVGGLAMVGYFFLIFDPSVTGGEMRVNNFGLLNDKQNGIIVGGILAIVGAIERIRKK